LVGSSLNDSTVFAQSISVPLLKQNHRTRLPCSLAESNERKSFGRHSKREGSRSSVLEPRHTSLSHTGSASVGEAEQPHATSAQSCTLFGFNL